MMLHGLGHGLEGQFVSFSFQFSKIFVNKSVIDEIDWKIDINFCFENVQKQVNISCAFICRIYSTEWQQNLAVMKLKPADDSKSLISFWKQQMQIESDKLLWIKLLDWKKKQ